MHSFLLLSFLIAIVLVSMAIADMDLDEFSAQRDAIAEDVRARAYEKAGRKYDSGEFSADKYHEERMKRHRDELKDISGRRHRSRSHEDRTRDDKEANYKHREFLRSRKDETVSRIHAAGFHDHEKAELAAKMEELHAHEMTLADSRLQIVLDFEGVRDMHDKAERRAYLDERKARREKQREKDEVTREKIKKIREHVDGRLRAAERGEL